MVIAGLLVAVLVGLLILKRVAKDAQRKARIAAIYAKYGHTELAERIIRRMYWVGQSSEELRDSLGAPADIDETILKTKRKEVWKYFHQGANRYGLRITLDNHSVVGWDEKL